MQRNISLDQPLLEQESVREMLNLLTEEVNPRVNLEDLLKIAQTIICFELVECGCNENELTGLRLHYTVINPKDENLQKTYSIEWRLPQVATDDSLPNSEPETSINSKPPIEDKFFSRLSERIEEARMNSGAGSTSRSTLSSTFRNASTHTEYKCEQGRCWEGETHFKVEYLLDKNGEILEDRGCSEVVKCQDGNDWNIIIT